MLERIFEVLHLSGYGMILSSLALGVAGLYYGADFLVKGAAELGLRLKIKPVIIGLTVVAFGTSAPELIVSLIAAVQGRADVSIGNIVGSNIANIGLIIGLTASLMPITRDSKASPFEFVYLFGVSFLMILLSLDGLIGRVDGMILFSLLLGFIGWSYKTGADKAAGELPVAVKRTAWASAALVVLGLVILPVAGQFMVLGATSLARRLGISELVIGITVVAVGTSLPELATSLLAVTRKQHDIGLGNIIGSNIFNICCVLGLSPMIRPLATNPDLLPFHLPVMMFFTLAFIELMIRSATIKRLGGMGLLGAFILYVVLAYLKA